MSIIERHTKDEKIGLPAMNQDLPPIHGDPFDRLLVAQAQCDGLKLLTHDQMIVQYGDVAVEI